MIQLKNYEVNNDKIYITIPFEMFCDEIIIYALTHMQVKLILINATNIFSSCKLIYKKFFYDVSVRKALINSPERIIQTLASVQLQSSIPINNFRYKLDFYGIHKGFFIECDNINEINEIILVFDHTVRFNYNKFLIKSNCVKITDQLIYLPFNINKSHYDRTQSGIEEAPDLSKIDNAILTVKVDTPKLKICIYALGINWLIYNDGLGGLVWHDIDDAHRHYDI